VTCASTLTKSFASKTGRSSSTSPGGHFGKELIEFDQAYGVDDTRRLQSSADKCRVEVHVEAPTVPLVFAELGGQVKSLFQTNGIMLKCQEWEARTAVQAVRQGGIQISGLESQELQYSPRLGHRRRHVLTERQFTSLQTAYYGGYFETGRASVTNSPSGWGSVVKPSIDTFDWAENTVLERLFEGRKGRTLTSQPDSLGRRCSCPEVMTSSTILTDSSTDRFGYDTIAETYHASTT